MFNAWKKSYFCKNQPHNSMSKKKPDIPLEADKQVVTIKLNKYKSVVDALGNPRTALRIAFTIFFLGVLLFAGISYITLAIKRLYPYSDIKTNGLGATTIKSENNEVSYWLFNTATVWADSGISVNEGDILTIRASGKSNTAIHHLYDAAKDNTEIVDDWVGTEGEPDKQEREKDNYRRRYRIFPNMNSGALVMQVARGNEFFDSPRAGDPEDFYFIGRERQNIVINNPGTLHFAVNDIILDRNTIARMMWDSIIEQGRHNPQKVNAQIVQEFRKNGVKYSLKDGADVMQLLSEKTNDEAYQQSLQKAVLDAFAVVFKEDISKKEPVGKMGLGFSGDQCELSYYYGEDQEDNDCRKYVWFEDNIGSFLIIVEKNNKRL